MLWRKHLMVFGQRVAMLALAAMAAFGASLPDASRLVLLGDTAYRSASFEQAESLYRQALDLDPKCSRAMLGLGRIEELRFARAAAHDHFAAAYHLSPADPRIIRAYASVAPNRTAEAILLKRYLAVGGDDRESLEDAVGQLQMSRQLGEREIGALESPYQSYVLPMTTYFAAWRPASMLLLVRINGGKPLRLIFDTGAEGVVISRRAAEKLGLEYLGSKQFRGWGSGPSSEGRMGLAQSLSIGDLRMKNCLVDVIDSLPAPDADGVIGPALLQRFLIRFDAGRRRLELTPFSEEASFTQDRPWWGVNRSIPAGMERYTKLIRWGHFLLTPGRVDGGFGYFLIDTGAAYSLVRPRGLETSMRNAVFGANGRLEGASRAQPVQFQIAGQPMTDSEAIASDLGALSGRAGIEISGVVGYPALSGRVLTINYRDGLIDAGR